MSKRDNSIENLGKESFNQPQITIKKEFLARGGPAFPCEIKTEHGDIRVVAGMSLQDYFAAAALTGLLMQGYDNFDPEEFADQAYKYADAMLDEREKI